MGRIPIAENELGLVYYFYGEYIFVPKTSYQFDNIIENNWYDYILITFKEFKQRYPTICRRVTERTF